MLLDAVFGGELKALPSNYGTASTRLSGRNAAANHVGRLSLMSYNLLAPGYKRPAEAMEASRARALAQIDVVRAAAADVVGLQEFTLAEEHSRPWSDFAAEAGYCMLVSPRTGGKIDGCCMLVREQCLSEAPKMETYSFEDWGNRIVQVVTLSLAGPAAEESRRLTLAHTHLTFPHDSGHDSTMRWHQARKLATWVSTRTQSAGVPLAVFGDLNGDVNDPAVSLLLESGSLTPHSTEVDWVSHKSHTGSLVACDLVATADGAATACRVASWALGGSREELVAGTSVSDHLPVSVSLELGPLPTAAVA